MFSIFFILENQFEKTILAFFHLFTLRIFGNKSVQYQHAGSSFSSPKKLLLEYETALLF